MAQLRRKEGGKPQRIYAFVDSVLEADAERPHSRMSIQLDAIDAASSVSSSGFLEDQDALLLARISTTPKRLGELFEMEGVKEGDWLDIRLEKQPSRPRAWQLPLATGYAPQSPLNVVDIKPLALDSEIVGRLEQAALAPEASHIVTEASLPALLRTKGKRNLRVTALDVGQAACVVFSDGSVPLGYFDVGAPAYSNQRSFPRKLDHTPASEGFVILSHWDFDHFALAFRYPELKQLQWFAPNQPVGPNTALFQRSLGANLTFIASDIDVGELMLRRCSGTSTRDRNSTGFALRVDRDGTGILLPGDADYRWLPPAISNNANRILVPHHGAAGTPPPPPGSGATNLAVVSYGNPNTYRHPHENQIEAHRRAGWRIRRTACHGTPARPRGNRVLFPI